MNINPLPIDTIRTRWMQVGPSADDLSWRRVLDGNERRRADQFLFTADRQAFVAAHALIRAMLSEATGTAPSAWRFVEGKYGKPLMASGSAELQFNISHTRSMVACAIAHWEVGVDVESIDRGADLRLLDEALACEESMAVKSQPSNLQRQLFFRYWTLKEAFIKATGEGLARPLKSFSFRLDPVRIQFHSECFPPPKSHDPEAWRFFETHASTNGRLAVAVQSPPSQPIVFDVGAARPEDITVLLNAGWHGR